MLQQLTLPLGAYQTNCYIVWNEGSDKCVVIDPGYKPDTVLTQVSRLGKTVEAILLTHGHFDHVGGVKAIAEATGCQLWMHEGDWSQQKTAENACLYPIANCEFAPVSFCEEGEQILSGGLTFTVLSTPGHTWGSVCYLCENTLFAGDTLFQGSCGRTDLGGSWELILQSLRRLKELPENTKVFPGHGPSTTIEEEKRWNPYMR